MVLSKLYLGNWSIRRNAVGRITCPCSHGIQNHGALGTRHSPFEMIYGRKIILPGLLELQMPIKPGDPEEYMKNLTQHLINNYKEAYLSTQPQKLITTIAMQKNHTSCQKLEIKFGLSDHLQMKLLISSIQILQDHIQ